MAGMRTVEGRGEGIPCYSTEIYCMKVGMKVLNRVNCGY